MNRAVGAARLAFAGLVAVMPRIGWANETQAPTGTSTSTVSVWYRSSADCPDGDGFLAYLTQRGTSARLAAVGDAVDFVVTLGSTDGTSAGRLERQTNQGTIAIRELSASSCAEIAEALAFSLSLAAQSLARGEHPGPVSGPPSESESPAETESSSERDPKPERRRPEQSANPSLRDLGARPAARAGDESSKWSLGADGLLATGIAPSGAFGASIFGGYEGRPYGFVRPTFRTSLALFRVATDSPPGDLRVTLVTARAEACPFSLDGLSLRAETCAALEVGPTLLEGTQSGGRSEFRVWAAGLGILRIRSTGNLWLEALGALSVPFKRYRLFFGESGASAPSAYTTAAVGFQAGLGGGVRLP